MNQSLNLNNKNLHYCDQGEGAVIVLLHGYLESLEIWGKFAQKLSKKHRVISIDVFRWSAENTFSSWLGVLEK